MSAIWTRGLGLNSVSSRSRVPMPPQRMTTGVEVNELMRVLQILGDWLAPVNYLEGSAGTRKERNARNEILAPPSWSQ